MGIRTKLTILLVSLAAIPALLSTYFVHRMTRGHLTLSTKEYRLAVADIARIEIDRFFDESRTEIISAANALMRKGVSSKEKSLLIKEALGQSRHLATISVYSQDGSLLFSLNKNTSVKQHVIPSFRRPDKLHAESMNLARHNDEHWYRTQYDNNQASVAVLYPVFKLDDSGTNQATEKENIHAYLWTRIGLETLTDHILELSERRFGRRRDRISIIDSTGLTVVNANRLKVGTRDVDHEIVGSEQVQSMIENKLAYSADYQINGEDVLGVLVPYPEMGWGIVVEQIAAEAYSSVRNTTRKTMLLAGIFALGALLLGLIVGKQISSPIRRMSKIAKAIAQGDFSKRIALKRNDEVGALATSFNQMSTSLQGYEQELVEETEIRTNLSRFLSRELVDQIVSKRQEINLGGNRARVVIVFADVVAFTPLAEKHEPEYVVGILNELFSVMTEIVFQHGGLVDKFIGDCMMAVFGLPEGQDDDVLRALRATEEIMQWLEAGNAKWFDDIGRDIALGIGIHYGDVVAGNIGSKQRMEYTVIGDTVNIAARLEGLAQARQVLTTQTVIDNVGQEFKYRSLGEHRLTGRDAPLELYEMLLDS